MERQLDEKTVEQLTRAAEEGRGSVIKEALDQVSLEERVRVLQQMDKTNAEHRKKDPQLPDLRISTSIPVRARYLELEIQHDPPGWFNTTLIYIEQYDPEENKRTVTAKNTKR